MRRCEFCDSPVPADATICPVCRMEIAEETLERILPILKRPEAPEVRSMGVFDRLWGVIRRPASTYRDIAQKPDYAGPFMIIIANALVIAGFFLMISSKFIVTVTINRTLGTTQDMSVVASPWGVQYFFAALAGLLPSILLGMVYLIIGSAFAHLAFKVTGGIGRKGQTISVVGYSMIPMLLFRLLALLVIFAVMPTYHLGTSTSTEVILAVYNSNMWVTIDYMTTVSFVWIGFLLIFGIREAHETSTGWAVLIAIASMLVLGWTFWQAH